MAIKDELTFPIPCPKCGHESPQTLAGLKNNPLLVCTSCGEKFQISADAATGEAADKVDEIDRLLNGFGKKP